MGVRSGGSANFFPFDLALANRSTDSARGSGRVSSSESSFRVGDSDERFLVSDPDVSDSERENSRGRRCQCRQVPPCVRPAVCPRLPARLIVPLIRLNCFLARSCENDITRNPTRGYRHAARSRDPGLDFVALYRNATLAVEKVSSARRNSRA